MGSDSGCSEVRPFMALFLYTELELREDPGCLSLAFETNELLVELNIVRCCQFVLFCICRVDVSADFLS